MVYISAVALMATKSTRSQATDIYWWKRLLMLLHPYKKIQIILVEMHSCVLVTFFKSFGLEQSITIHQLKLHQIFSILS